MTCVALPELAIAVVAPTLDTAIVLVLEVVFESASAVVSRLGAAVERVTLVLAAMLLLDTFASSLYPFSPMPFLSEPRILPQSADAISVVVLRGHPAEVGHNPRGQQLRGGAPEKLEQRKT